MRIAVLDIGGTSIKGGVFEDGILENLTEQPTQAMKGGAKVMENAISMLKELQPFERIGISTAGQVDSGQGVIKYANSNIPGYTGMKIREILEREFAVPIAVENDVNAAAIGEASFGAGRDVQDFLCLTYGTGVGGAIVIDKKIYTGDGFSAGEFGGIITHASRRNPAKDLFSGCYERYASATALVQRASEMDESLTNGRKIFERLSEPAVQQVVDEWIEEIVHGLVTLIHIFNPSCIVLGGGVMKQEYILEKLQDILYNSIMPSFQNVDIRQAELGNQAGLLGAVRLAAELS